jgi:hypothetical protein
MIQLRPTAIIDLNQRFARDMGNNKIRHYVVSQKEFILAKVRGITVHDLIREFIKDSEGETEVEFVETHLPILGEPKANGSPLQVTDITSIVLGEDRNVQKALEKFQAKSQIHQSIYYRNTFDKIRGALTRRYNRVVPGINSFLRKIQGIEYGSFEGTLEPVKGFLLPYAQDPYLRVMNLTSYIVISFFQKDTEKAFLALRKDLRLLYKKGLIMGNVAMPSLLILADTVGAADSRPYALFCFPIIDSKRLEKLTGKGPSELPRPGKQLSLVGVEYEAMEGGLNFLDGKSPEQQYEIEEVRIGDLTSDQARKQVIDTYENTKEYVNESASKMKSQLNNLEKVESRTKDVPGGVEVDVTLRNKTTGKEFVVRSGKKQ